MCITGGKEYPYLWKHRATEEPAQRGHAISLPVYNCWFMLPVPTHFSLTLHFSWNVTIKMSSCFFDLFPYERSCVMLCLYLIHLSIFFYALAYIWRKIFLFARLFIKISYMAFSLTLQRPYKAVIWTLNSHWGSRTQSEESFYIKLLMNKW